MSLDYINSLCALAGQHGASDIFLQAEKLPQFRINGELTTVGEQAITPDELEEFWYWCGADKGALDFDGSFVSSEGLRFRANFYRSLFKRGAVLRQIKTEIPALETLGLPTEVLTSWIAKSSGLILIAGPTGSGKSTTVASSLEWLNQNFHRHVVTIEDPVEYLFTPAKCLFTQREVHSDTSTFAEGLRRSLRQSPDVILLGEIRDNASALTALQAAETGHIVVATLHSSNVLDTLERLTGLVPSGERQSVLQLLSKQLIGVLCQKLLPALPEGRALVVEHFENQAVTRKYIVEEKFRELADFLNKGDNPLNVTFLQSLVAMVQAGRLTEEVAMQAASNPQELQRRLRGISSASVKG